MEEKLTPAMQQYYKLKEQVSDAILFFRMGDFYEMFGDDAHIANQVLGVALTTRNKNSKQPIPLAGIPYHAKEKYLPKLVEAGYKVAIAEQVSDPQLKGIVKREIVNIITPGTLHIEMDTQNTKSHYIIGIVGDIKSGKFGLSIMDMTSGQWKCGEVENFEKLVDIVYKYSPDELVLDKQLFGENILKDVLGGKLAINIFYFQTRKEYTLHLQQHFGVKNLEGYGVHRYLLAQQASSLILDYISSHQHHNLEFLDALQFETFSGYLDIDNATFRSLDILYNFYTKSTHSGTLLGILDMTQTAMGARFLKNALAYPLQNLEEIEKRQKFISIFVQDIHLLEQMRKSLKKIADIDVLLYRIALKKAQPRDLLALKNSLYALQEIDEILKKTNHPALQSFFIK